MTSSDTNIVALKGVRGRYIDRLSAISTTFQDWIRHTPVEDSNFADRDVIRNARDLADATHDMLTYLRDSTVVPRRHQTALILDVRHTIAMLESLARPYGITIPGPVEVA
jgi:hypothetical protein